MIKIEVTGNSIPEVADKLLAIGASLRSAPTAFQPTEPANSITPSNIDPVMPELREVAKAAPVDPTPAPKSAPVATATESQPTTEEPSSTPAPAASASELDFELDVAPVVLRAVGSKGKAFVQDVLSEFGSARASQLAVDLWPELIARLEAEMA
jgi:pyruvate/2-oxoglutarate dehydrogenase complex dihydrolipoamide acyltransferase (E2) component